MFIRNDAPDTKENLNWRKGEMIVSCAVFAGMIFYGLIDAVRLSDELKPKVVGLQPTFWSDSSRADLDDGQWSSFRSNLVLIALAAALQVWICSYAAKFGPQCRLKASLLYGLGFAGYMHGPGCVFLISMVVANYAVARLLKGNEALPYVAWGGNLGFLVITEYYHGYTFAALGLPTVLDDFPRVMSWHRVNNLCMLKIISFMLDLHWSRLPSSSKAVRLTQQHKQKCNECTDNPLDGPVSSADTVDCLKLRTETSVHDYSLLGFAAYFFYAPLYLAGPTTTYNAWTSQVYKPQQTHTQRQILTYAVRWLVVLAILEWFCHNLVFPTIANNSENKAIWESFTAYQYVIASYFILKWIWLKFTVIWRFFRLWALCDGIESPENMGRCMSNNYCFEDFWRQWHRAFNQWLIRYLFIPLGGSQYKIWNIWVIFGFVAIWHDLSMNLLAWGWGMCLFIMPEVVVKRVLAGKNFTEFRKSLTYNWLCAFAGGCYALLMSFANLVGFSFGIKGLGIFLNALMTPEGTRVVTMGMLFLTFGIHFMFALRRHEARSGIKRNY